MSERRATSWYVISGGPGAGKTTMIRLLEKRGYATVPEQARRLIDDELSSGKSYEEIRTDETEFQRRVVAMQVAAEAAVPPSQITFFDRGIPDSLAYYRVNSIPEDEVLLHALAACSYRKVFLLETYPIIPDYARRETPEAQAKARKEIIAAYEALPFPIEYVPRLPPEERLDYLLSRL